MEVKLINRKQLHKVKPLLSHNILQNYWPYRLVSSEKVEKMLYEELSGLLGNKNNFIILAQNQKEILGLISLANLAWDTRIFGIKMVEIKHIIVNNDSYAQSAKIKNPLIRFMLEICKKEKILHVSHRTPTDDFSVIHCLESNGFLLMDTLLTYIVKHTPKLPDTDFRCTVRRFKKGDLGGVIDLAKLGFHRNRFYIDPHIPKDKADEMYAEWTERFCKNKKYCASFVALRNNKIVGFSVTHLRNELRKIGIKCFGRGLMVVSPEGVGSAAALFKANFESFKKRKVDFVEIDTQVYKDDMVTILERMGLKFVKSVYTFHRWNKWE